MSRRNKLCEAPWRRLSDSRGENPISREVGERDIYSSIKHYVSEYTITQIWLFPSIDHLGDCMPDDNPRPFDLFSRQARGHAYLERGLHLPPHILRGSVDCAWHAFDSSNQHSVCQRLAIMVSI